MNEVHDPNLHDLLEKPFVCMGICVFFFLFGILVGVAIS